MTETIETPSGKGAGDENFPVGSWLLPAALRPHVATYYAFARAIDDIADNPHLAPEEKIQRLDRFAAALSGEGPAEPRVGTGTEKAVRLRASLAETGVSARHGLDLVLAFKQDAVKLRYDDWPDLIAYCNLSAAPVGRYLLDLHGEDKALHRGSDALCNALQVLNHLQDCKDDYRNLDRVYLPQDWMAELGAQVSEIGAERLGPRLRAVIDRCLEGVAGLLDQARPLPLALANRRLALETGIIVRIAQRLARELRRRDPLAERVVLTKRQFLTAAVAGMASTLVGRAGAGRAGAALVGWR